MENQHRQIAGYRELSQEEIDAMNRIKAKAAEVRELLDGIRATAGIDQRALAVATTELQTGFMWAVRAIAQPAGF